MDNISLLPPEVYTEPEIIQVPFNEEAEESVLGSILIAPEYLPQIKGILEKDAFYIHRNRYIFDAIERVSNRGFQIDLVTVGNELQSAGKLEEVGGISYLTRLLNSAYRPSNSPTYAKIVHANYVRRMMIEASREISRMAYNEEAELDDCLSFVVEQSNKVAGKSILRDTHLTMREAMSLQFDHLEKVAKGEIVRTPTGWRELDRLLSGGFKPRQFIIFAGRPGSGKSAAMLTAAWRMARYHYQHKTGKTVIFYTLEMDAEEVSNRLVALYGIDSQHIETGQLTESESGIYLQALEELAKLPLIIEDIPVLYPEKLRANVARHSLVYDIGEIFIDYIQLMVDSISVNNRNRVQELSFVSRSLKLLAREFDITVSAGSQLSRAVEQRDDKRPILSDLRDSGSLEQDADIVIFVHRPDRYKNSKQNSGKSQFLLDKQRNGPVGEVDIRFRNSYTRFDNYRNYPDKEASPEDESLPALIYVGA